MPKKEEKLSKEQEKTLDFMKLSHDSITKLFKESDPTHPADKVYAIARAIGYNLPNEVSIIWSMEAIIDAFDQEIEEWNNSKNKARNAVVEKLNVFKKKFDDSPSFAEKKIESIN